MPERHCLALREWLLDRWLKQPPYRDGLADALTEVCRTGKKDPSPPAPALGQPSLRQEEMTHSQTTAFAARAEVGKASD